MSAIPNVAQHTRPARELHHPAGTIGAILIADGRLKPADAERVLEAQRKSRLPFGETGIRLGVLNTEDVQFALAKQFSLTRLPAGDASIDPAVVAAFRPAHPLVEQVRHLRGQLMLRWLNSEVGTKAVALVGVHEGVGCSFVAANLAVVFAQLGQRVLLIDADLQRPHQHQLFKIPNRAGLSTLLAGRAGDEVLHPIPTLPGLTVLPAGPKPPNTDDLLSRPEFGTRLEAFAGNFDAILVDAPAWSEGAGTRMLVARTRSAVLVARTGRTAASDAMRMAADLAAANVLALGVVFNRA